VPTNPYAQAYLNRLYAPTGSPGAYTPKAGGMWGGAGGGTRKKKDDDGGGIGLGFGNLIGEIGQGITALASLATPGKDGPGFVDVGKGLASSVAGTGIRGLEGSPLGPLASLLGVGDTAREQVGQTLGSTPEEEAALTPQTSAEAIQDRGILPVLVEDVGNVALVGGAATAPVKAASWTARIAGAESKAASLAALHEGLIARPTLQAVQHPYRTAGRALRETVTKPAHEAVHGRLGPDITDTPDVDLDAPDLEPGAVETVTEAAGAPTLGQQFLSRVEDRLLAHDAARVAREQTRMADMERRIAMRSPATRAAVAAARDHVLDAGRSAGLSLSRKEASLIVGDEVRARMTGTKALEEEYLGRGVPEDVVAHATGRQRWIPEPLRQSPDLEAALVHAVDEQIKQRVEVRRTLEEGRKGSKGLDGDPDEPTLTRKQAKMLREAERRLERANSEVLDRKIGRERESRVKHVASLNDRLGRIAEDSRRLSEDMDSAVADFEHSRSWTPKAWRGKGAMEATAQAIYDQTIANVAEHNGEWGGASFNPHTGRFVVGGSDTGHAVGLVKDTAITVPVEEFTPQHIEQVIRAYQDVYQHPNTIVGTWVEDGKVYIDPSEIVPTLDDALIRGAARRQLSTYDVAGDDVVSGILKDRPDIAEPFINRHKHLSARLGELRQIAERSQISQSDVNVMADLLMRQAVRAWQKGMVSHPDEFFRKFVSRFEYAKKGSRRQGVLKQIVLERKAGTPEERAALWREMTANVRDVSKVRAWYHESHDLIERLFRNQADVTLLDGSKINPADLMYQIVAITSFQAMPRDNWTRAMAAFQRFDDLPAKEIKQYVAALKKVTSGKATLEQAFGIGGPALAERFAGFGLYPEPKQYLAELFSGRTIDTWDAEYLAGPAIAGFGKKGKNLDRAKALGFIDAEHPGLIERIGEDAAVKEFFGRQHRAKIINFHDNLANPDSSLGVTMDQQMERLFGEGMPESGGGDAWIKYSEHVRDMAVELSEALGEQVLPHEIQAVMWVFAKEEINRLQVGHFNAFAHDAIDMVKAGEQITDDIDPILTWIDEASEPYVAEGQRHVRQMRVLRDEIEPPKVKPPISHGRSPLDYGTSEPVLRMEVRDPNAEPSRDLNYADDPTRLAFIDYSPDLRRPGEVYIHFMSVRPEARGQGLSRALLDDLYKITGDQKIDFGSIEAPEVEVMRRKMAEAHPEKGNYGKPARGITDEAKEFEATLPAGRKGEAVEDVIFRPGWGAKNREGKIALFAKRRAQWLAERAEINAALAVGDVDAAAKQLSTYVTHMQTKAPRSLGLADDAPGGSFMDIWKDGSFHSAGFREAAAALDRLDVNPGDLPPLLQSFRDKVLGEFVPMDDGTRGVIRIFEDGNLATLVHENGHLLRRLLDEPQARAVEGAYGLKGRRWDVAAEERFADDLLHYMTTGKAPDGLTSAFQRVKEALHEVWEMVRATFQGRRVPEELRTVFDDWFAPEPGPTSPGIAGLPELVEDGTLRQRAARPPRLPQPPAKTGDYYAAGRKGAQALARMEKLAARQRSMAATTAQIEKQIEQVRQVLDEGRLPSELERDSLVAGARVLEDKVHEQLGRASVTRTPARWQPMFHAVKEIGEAAKKDPGLAAVLDGLPETLYDIQRLAAEHGVDPAHVADLSPAKVRRLVFGSMRLGRGGDMLHEMEAGTRKARTGVLSKAGAVDRSIEGFTASVIEATVEKRTNAVVDWVEQNTSRRIAQGEEIPDGWVPWDPVRTFLLTGTEISQDTQKALAGTEMTIVPEPVVKTLQRFTKDYDHWAFRAISKVTSPWRTLVLTLSPGWYVRNVVGNVILATAEGVSLKDWRAAWRSARTKDEIGRFADVPFVTSDTLAQEAGVYADDSLVPQRGLSEAVKEGGKIRGAASFASRRLLRVNEVVDEFARSAVYHRGRRLNMTPEQAWTRAKEALVDYNALSPFERQAVRSVIPFYAWQKGILKVTLNQALDHPARASTLALLGQMQDEYLADRFGVEPGDIPDYYKHLVGSRNLRSFNPFADPSEITTVEGITRSFNPFIELAIRKGLGAPEFYSDDRRLGYFGQAQQDFSVPGALGEMVTRSPGGKILGEGPGLGILGLQPVDDEVLRERFLKARKTISGSGTRSSSPTAPALF
jgi:GNAT superfamily N-acetyltransferase